MFVECTHPDHRLDTLGRISCPAPNCLPAALDAAARGHRLSAMDRLPAARPDWILSSPDVLDEAEVEALAVLGDAGLIPQIVTPGEDDAHPAVRPAGRAAQGLPTAVGR